MSDQINDMQDRVKEIQRVAAEVEGEALSENGEVRVVAGAGGRVKEIDLRMSAFELSGLELGEIIVETIHAANQKADETLSEAVNSLMSGVLPDEDADNGEGGLR